MIKKKTLSRTDENKIKSILKNAVAKANKAVYDRTEDDIALKGMGTTLVATLLCCGTLFTVNVGDSRMYLITEGSIRQISHDHSYVQFLIDTGRISPEDARTSNNRNIITRAVGTDQTVEADVYINRAVKNGYVLLCSDGLVNFVPAEEMYNTVNDIGNTVTEEAIDECLDTLILAANTAGGSDNITVVLMAL
ncbi:MAG: serine/threonine-protein phosphatase [Clostridia bacterium]|nr:serine/threonine-protein phosphatase [Clostridia bacterium]